jgi:hypothetical protein
VDRKLMEKPTANPFRRRAILRDKSNAKALAPEERDPAYPWHRCYLVFSPSAAITISLKIVKFFVLRERLHE